MGCDARGGTASPRLSENGVIEWLQVFVNREEVRFNAGIILITLARLAATRMTDEARRRLAGANRWSGPINKEPLMLDHMVLR